MVKEDQHKINDKIRAREVRVVEDNVEVGIYSLKDALAIAEEQELDLVEISPNAEPPVCKVMDYKKFIYEQKKREKALKAKATKVVIKEIRFGPNTDDHDYDFKKTWGKVFEGRSQAQGLCIFQRPIDHLQRSGRNPIAAFSARP